MSLVGEVRKAQVALQLQRLHQLLGLRVGAAQELLERVAQGPHAHTPLQGRKIRKLRREHAIDQDQPPSFG